METGRIGVDASLTEAREFGVAAAQQPVFSIKHVVLVVSNSSGIGSSEAILF